MNGDPSEAESEGVRISDRRRIDPVTFEARPQPAEPAAAPGEAPGAPLTKAAGGPAAAAADVPSAAQEADQQAVAEANARADEAIADAKRIAAEYTNYRRRVERDREVQAEAAIRAVFFELLPVLDDIDRARQHDELSGGFKSVGEAVEAVARKFGVEQYGEADQPFDPAEHEAMTSEHSDDVAEPTVVRVYQIGYKFRGKLLRPARVGVVDKG